MEKVIFDSVLLKNALWKIKKIAFLVADGFEELGVMVPHHGLESFGIKVEMISFDKRTVCGWDQGAWGEKMKADCLIKETSVEQYDAIYIPEGILHIDSLRGNIDAINFIRDMFNSKKLMAALGHGPQLLIDADVAKGRRLTSHPVIQADLKNAGAEWLNAEVVVDNQLITGNAIVSYAAFTRHIIGHMLKLDYETVGENIAPTLL